MQYAEEAAAQENEEVTELRSTLEVITLTGKKEKRGSTEYILKNTRELEAAKPKIVDILFRATKTETDIARFSLTYNDSDKKQYLIFPKQASGEAQRAPEVFDREASNEEITSSIQNLNKFVDAYRTFVSEPDKHGSNLSRIYEIVLYSFTAAYVFKLRQEVSGSKSDIPIMLVIGGRAASGKSNLLAYHDELRMAAAELFDAINEFKPLYDRHLTELETLTCQKTSWKSYTKQEKVIVENTIRLVALMNKLCQVQLVLKPTKENELEHVNEKAVKTAVQESSELVSAFA